MPMYRCLLSALFASSLLIGPSNQALARGGPGGGGVRVGVAVGGPAVRGGVVVGSRGGFHAPAPYRGGYPYPRYGYRGYGYGGYGYGLGLGVGLGLGAAYAYPGYGYGYGYAPYYAYPPAVAYPVYQAYPSTYVVPSVSSGYDVGPGNGIVPPPSGAGVPPPTPMSAAAMRIPDPAAPSSNSGYSPTPVAIPSPANAENAKVFVTQGDQAFRKGDYAGAVYAWRHAAIDNPQDATVTLKLGQALFAVGQFEEAAGATQGAMQQLPKEAWGTVVRGYREIYGKPQDYTRQLRVLEKAIQDKPENPGLRFLAGFHYSQLGFTKQAVEQLDRLLKLVPGDELARQLRDDAQGTVSNKPDVADEAVPVSPARIPESKEGPALPGVSE